MDIADYVILVVLLFSAWDGYRTGLVKQLVRLTGTILAYVVAWQFHGILTPIVDHWLLGTVFKHVHSLSSASIPIVGLLGSGTTIPTVATIAKAVANALSFGVVFYVALIVIRYLGHLLNTLFSLPVLSFVNRVAGLVAGAVVAFMLIAVLINVASYLPASPIKAQIKQSSLAPMFQEPVKELAHIEGSWLSSAKPA